MADVHGSVLAGAAVLRAHARQRRRCIVNFGDRLSGPLEPQNTFDLRAKQHIIASVCGNEDRAIAERNLPTAKVASAPLRVPTFLVQPAYGSPASPGSACCSATSCCATAPGA
jgi:hypothetical protein